MLCYGTSDLLKSSTNVSGMTTAVKAVRNQSLSLPKRSEIEDLEWVDADDYQRMFASIQQTGEGMESATNIDNPREGFAEDFKYDSNASDSEDAEYFDQESGDDVDSSEDDVRCKKVFMPAGFQKAMKTLPGFISIRDDIVDSADEDDENELQEDCRPLGPRKGGKTVPKAAYVPCYDAVTPEGTENDNEYSNARNEKQSPSEQERRKKLTPKGELSKIKDCNSDVCIEECAHAPAEDDRKQEDEDYAPRKLTASKKRKASVVEPKSKKQQTSDARSTPQKQGKPQNNWSLGEQGFLTQAITYFVIRYRYENGQHAKIPEYRFGYAADYLVEMGYRRRTKDSVKGKWDRDARRQCGFEDRGPKKDGSARSLITSVRGNKK